MSAHTCRTFNPGCYRCDLGRDEMAAILSECHEEVPGSNPVLETEPCNRPAFGWRLDEENLAYPVCLIHHRWPYADGWVEAERDRDRARDIAVSLEQENARLEQENTVLQRALNGEVKWTQIGDLHA